MMLATTSRIDTIIQALSRLLEQASNQKTNATARPEFEQFCAAYQVLPGELAEARIQFLSQQISRMADGIARTNNQDGWEKWYKSLVTFFDYTSSEVDEAVARLGVPKVAPEPPKTQIQDFEFASESRPQPTIQLMPANPIPKEAETLDDSLTGEVHELGRRIQKILNGLTYLPGLSRKALRVYKLCYSIAPSVNLKTIGNEVPNLVGHVGVHPDTTILVVPGGVEVHVPIEEWEPVLLKKFLPSAPPIDPVKPGESIDGPEFLCGFNLEGQILTIPKAQKVLVAGASKSGKTGLIVSNLCAWSMWYSPDQLRFALCDIERSSLGWFEDSNMLFRPKYICQSAEEYFNFFKYLMKEREDRANMFAEAGVREIGHWNRRFPDRQLPYIVVVVEEINQTVRKVDAFIQRKKDEDKSYRPPFPNAIDPLAEFGEVARKQGFGIVTGSQRPSADVVSSHLKANVDDRVCLHVNSDGDSQVAFGYKENLGRKLKWYGDGYWVSGNQRFQALWLGNEEDAEVLVKDIVRWRNAKSPHAFSGICLDDDDLSSHDDDRETYDRYLELIQKMSKSAAYRQLFSHLRKRDSSDEAFRKMCERIVEDLERRFA